MHIYCNSVGIKQIEITKNVYESFRMQLITSLPMDDVKFLGLLRQKDLLPSYLEEEVQAESTRTNKTKLFLDKIIYHSIVNGDTEPLNNLLTVMNDETYISSDTLKQLATKIKQQLNEDTLLTPMNIPG